MLVVTRPDRPRGRGRRLAPPPVAEAARALDLECFQPTSVNSDDARERIARCDPEVVCICAFGALVKDPLLSAYPMLNVHPSLLPRWRGAAPIERAIDAGDHQTGVSIMRPTAELDAGPVCLQRAEPIHPDDDFASLSTRLERIAAELVIEAIDGSPEFVEQASVGVSFADKVSAADRRLDPTHSAHELERRVRALRPHIGAYVERDGGERLGVWDARVVSEGVDPSPGVGVLAEQGGRLLLRCGDLALELLEVQAPGGRRMDVAAYLRGRRGR